MKFRRSSNSPGKKYQLLLLARQKIPTTTPGDYSKVCESLFAFVKKCPDDYDESIVNLGDLANDKFMWNLAFMELIRNTWINLELSELVRVMSFVRIFARVNIKNAVSCQEIKKWNELIKQVIIKSMEKGIGLVYYLADVYIEEIKYFEFEVLTGLLEPFVEMIKNVQVTQLIDMIYSRIFLRMKNLNNPEISTWIYNIAISQNDMYPLAREKLYDLYTLLKNEQAPECECLMVVKEKNENYKYTPVSLQKVLKQFYKKRTPKKTKRVLFPKAEDAENNLDCIESPSINIFSPSPQKKTIKNEETPKLMRIKKKKVIIRRKPITRNSKKEASGSLDL
ncbi:hypothetical protein SteCoe_17593 [Stentor coeruleus]|uniref:Uncharacterized protein n=1 Tax=Stentor coeruleus TaxID=5963 RepID=A0A1R2BYP3_9CILI|nr:hypothetical protein SteCoe_17593 [Stentor coeruleus]